MEDFAAILQRDYGLKPQGKSAPMSRASAPPKPKSTPSSRPSRSSPQEDLLFGGNGFMAPGRSTAPPPGSGSAADLLGGAGAPVAYDDVFGGPPKFASPAFTSQASPMQNYDDIFRMPAKASSTSSLPVFDVPVYDDDIFGGVPGVRSASVAYDDVFSGGSGAGPSPAAFEDLLGGFGTAEPKAKSTHWTNSQKSAAMNSGGSLGGDSTHDELLPGFGVAEPAKPRSAGESKASHKASQRTSSGLVNHSPRKVANDPFVVLERDPVVSSAPSAPPFSDLDPFNVPLPSPEAGGKKVSINGVSESVTGFDGNSPSAPTAPGSFTKSTNTIKENFRRNETDSPARSTGGRESSEAKSVRKNYPSHNSVKDQTKSPRKSVKVEHDRSFNSYEPAASRSHSPSVRNQHLPREDTVPPTNQRAEEPVQFPMADRRRNIDEFWITVDDIKLVTQPSSAPPPSRPPPPPGSKQGSVSRKPVDVKPEVTHDTCVNLNGFSAHQQAAATSWQPPHSGADSTTKVTSKHASNVFDELEEFASGVARVRKEATLQEEEQAEGSAAAAAASATAMKEAMERAEAKLRLANEARERERQEKERDVKASKAREERERAREAREREAREAWDREIREARERESLELREREAREAREREAREAEIQEREAREMREREEKEKAAREAHEKEEREEREFRERRRKEREREKDKEREREREKDRIAVERATQEARERAAAEARERAERAAVERATAEARARAERAAVERANSEARERAAERVAMGRAATEARDRAEKAAAAREQQRRNENDLESFFMSGSRASSAPRQRPAATDTSSDARPANKGFLSEVQRSSTGAAGLRKVASTVNMADDWTSLFSAGPTTDDFQEMEGESADRRRARWERHQRTLERAAKALDEKNQRDLQGQREQAERHRAAEMLDAEIKRWAAGKEGNLRALLSTLQYVLWPECGWQPVSLTDLITGAAVKKVYRKATLCVHPDKVQQKGATIQQKYIAEKVFDYLKEAWNKFNSEELF